MRLCTPLVCVFKIAFIAVALSLTLMAPRTWAADAILEAEIPTDASSFYYIIGGGNTLPEPITFEDTKLFNFSMEAGAGRTCGQFDPYLNVEAIMGQIMSKIRRLPSQFMGAIEGAIIGLPDYLLNKGNAALYNVITKNIDDSFNLYDLSKVSCEWAEREVKERSSVYFDMITAAKGQNWREQTNNAGDKTIDLIDEQVTEEGVDKGIMSIGGKDRGGKDQEPIQLNRDVVLAGYNSLLGRDGDMLREDAPSAETVALDSGGSMAAPMVKMFPSPKAASDWLTEVVGERAIKLADGSDGSTVDSKAGRGLLPEVETHTLTIRKALQQAVYNNDYSGLEPYQRVLQVGYVLIDAIRAAPAFDQSIMLDRLASEYAVNFVQYKTMMARRMLYAGLRDGNIALSEGGGAIREHIRGHTLPDLDASLDEIHEDLDLRLKTVNRTSNTIMQHAAAADSLRQDRAGGYPMIDPVIDGGVVKDKEGK